MNGSTAKFRFGGLLGVGLVPLIDLVVCCAALASGMTSWHGQLVGFMIAAPLACAGAMRAVAGQPNNSPNLASTWHVLVVGVLALILRGGVFALLTDGGWSAYLASAIAVLVSCAIISRGFAYALSFPDWDLGRGSGCKELAVGLIAVSFMLRLVYSSQVELLPEEAYYWNYSCHLDIGYLDHPPMVAWVIRAGTLVFGDTAFGVRSMALCCGALTGLFIFRLTRNLFGERSALVAVVLSQTLPFFFLSGMLMTPDAPLTACWAATLYFIERALVGGRAAAWSGVGICFGIGLLSKYTIGLLGLSTLLFMLLDPGSRHWLRRWEPYLAALMALAVFSPVIVWNAGNDWASFVFQTSRRLAESHRFALHELLLAVLVLLTPLGFVAAARVLVGGSSAKGGATENQARAGRLMKVSALVPLVIFAVFSLRHPVKLDWTGAPWTAVLPAFAFGVVGQEGDGRREKSWLRSAWTPTLILSLLSFAGLLCYLALGLPGVGYGKHVELLPVGWRELGTQIAGIAEGSPDDLLVVGMDRYALASEMAFYAPDRARSVRDTSSAHLFGQVGLMYEQWFPIREQRGRNLLLVAWRPEDLDGPQLRSCVERWDPIRMGQTKRDGRLVRRYYYRLAYGYRGLPDGQ